MQGVQVRLPSQSIEDYVWEKGFCKAMAREISQRSTTDKDVAFWDKVQSKLPIPLTVLGLGKVSMEDQLRQMAQEFTALKLEGQFGGTNPPLGRIIGVFSDQLLTKDIISHTQGEQRLRTEHMACLKAFKREH